MSAFGNLSGLGGSADEHREAAVSSRSNLTSNAQEAIAAAKQRDCKGAIEGLLLATADLALYRREAYYADESEDVDASGDTASDELYAKAKKAVFAACMKK